MGADAAESEAKGADDRTPARQVDAGHERVSRSFHAPLRDVLAFFTVAGQEELSYLLNDIQKHSPAPAWPSRPTLRDRLVSNLLLAWYAFPACVAFYCIAPFLLPLRWLIRRGISPERAAERWSLDGLYQVIARVAPYATDEPADLSVTIGYGTEDVVATWELRAPLPAGTFELSVRERGLDGGVESEVDMSLSTGTGSTAEPEWPEPLGARSRGSSDESDASPAPGWCWTARTSASERLRDVRRREAREDDVWVLFADWLGGALELRGLTPRTREHTPDTRAMDTVVALRSSSEAASAEDVVTQPQRAPLLVRKPRTQHPSWLASWGRLRTWVADASLGSVLPLVELVAALVIVTWRTGGGTELLAGLGIVFAVALPYPWLVFLPGRRRVRVREAPEADSDPGELVFDGSSLRAGRFVVDLDSPFQLALAREPYAKGHLVCVDIRSREASPTDPHRLRFCVPAADVSSITSLPELHSRAPIVAAEPFANWLWPLLRARAEAHGVEVPWQFELRRTHTTPERG